MTKAFKRLFAFVAGVCVMFCVMQTPLISKAESVQYTSVSEDLGKDGSFSKDNYPTKNGDYSIQIIQLAESVNKELFVYTYQPSGDKVKASSVNISTTINDEISYHNYKLELLNFDGTLFKYKVAGFEVKTAPVRYYVISNIYRPFDEGIGDKKSGNNTINEVNYAVNRQYCFGEINGKQYVSCVDIETIVITDKFVGFVRYPDGFKLFTGAGACDSHFVAFNTDKKIDKLFEADVYYTTQKVSYDFFTEDSPFSIKFGDSKTDNYAYLKYTDKVEHTGGGFFAGTYKWDRIQSVDDFIKTEDRTTVYYGAVLNSKVSSKLTDEALNELKGKKWVLRFTETGYNKSTKSGMGAATYYHAETTMVGNVTILRLKFETDGITYNLGVIDNKQTGGTEPIQKPSNSVGSTEFFVNENGKHILAIVLIALLVLALIPVLPYVLSLIVVILSLPVRLASGIVSVFKSFKRKRDERRNFHRKE